MSLFNRIVRHIIVLSVTFAPTFLSSVENPMHCPFVAERASFVLQASEVSVITSLVDPATISRLIEKCYSLEGFPNVRLLNVGINDMYLVEANSNKYVLRLSCADKYLTMTESEFQFELEWLEFSHQHGASVSFPIRRSDNLLYGLIQAPEGPRFFTLFSYAEGNGNMNREQACILGKALAQLHITSDDFKTSLNRSHLDIDSLINHPLQQIKDFLGSTDESTCALLEKMAKELTEQISAMDKSQLSYGVIGGDVHGHNQHFAADNSVTMFDFEFCAYGPRVYDIATFRWSRGAGNPELWHSFLEGYQSIRELSHSEMQVVDVFVKARNFWWMGMRTALPESKHKLDSTFWERALSRFHPK